MCVCVCVSWAILGIHTLPLNLCKHSLAYTGAKGSYRSISDIVQTYLHNTAKPLAFSPCSALWWLYQQCFLHHLQPHVDSKLEDQQEWSHLTLQT